MNGAEICAAVLHDSEEDRVICVREESLPGAWTFICSSCWEVMLNKKAKREEWKAS